MPCGNSLRYSPFEHPVAVEHADAREVGPVGVPFAEVDGYHIAVLPPTRSRLNPHPEVALLDAFESNVLNGLRTAGGVAEHVADERRLAAGLAHALDVNRRVNALPGGLECLDVVAGELGLHTPRVALHFGQLGAIPLDTLQRGSHFEQPHLVV